MNDTPHTARPDGTVVQHWVPDDTLPTGPYRKERRWVAPFARASREDDYRLAWAFFAAQATTPTGANNAPQATVRPMERVARWNGDVWHSPSK